MPVIPVLQLCYAWLSEGNVIHDFEKKAALFNNHFALQCSLVKNASTLPNLEYRTDVWLNYFEVNENDIF